jgi:hypothetical protein
MAKEGAGSQAVKSSVTAYSLPDKSYVDAPTTCRGNFPVHKPFPSII